METDIVLLEDKIHNLTDALAVANEIVDLTEDALPEIEDSKALREYIQQYRLIYDDI